MPDRLLIFFPGICWSWLVKYWKLLVDANSGHQNSCSWCNIPVIQWTLLTKDTTASAWCQQLTSLWPQHNNILVMPTEHLVNAPPLQQHLCVTPTADKTSPWPQYNNIPVIPTEHLVNAPLQQHMHDANSWGNSSVTPTQHPHTPNSTCLQMHLLSNNICVWCQQLR